MLNITISVSFVRTLFLCLGVIEANNDIILYVSQRMRTCGLVWQWIRLMVITVITRGRMIANEAERCRAHIHGRDQGAVCVYACAVGRLRPVDEHSYLAKALMDSRSKRRGGSPRLTGSAYDTSTPLPAFLPRLLLFSLSIRLSNLTRGEARLASFSLLSKEDVDLLLKMESSVAYCAMPSL